MLKTSSVPYFIHTLQLDIKNSLFEDDGIEFLLAKVRKLVCYISHCSKASELLKKQIDFDHAQKKTKALLWIQDVETRWISTYLMLERLKKLKSIMRLTMPTIKI